MIPIIFSIPIHEKLEIVLDQIKNYKYFNPECGIVFHFSDKFDYTNSGITREEFEKAIREIDNIFLNPMSLRTGHADIIQAHMSNFSYMENQCEFEYFALCASNDLFIRPGLYQWIRGYDCGVGCIIVDAHTQWWYQGKMANKDPVLQKILHEVGGDKIRGSQEEGAFFTKKLFHDICEVVNRNYDYHLMEFVYAREEVYFSTIIWNWKSSGRKIRVYTRGNFEYMPWKNDLRIEIDDIKCQLEQKDQFFSVKRIERELNDPVRSYIREEIGGGYLSYRSRLYKVYSVSGNPLFGDQHLKAVLSFSGRNMLSLLQEAVQCLILAVKEHSQKDISKSMITLLEQEYGNELWDSIVQGDLDVIKYLVRINGMIYNDMPDYIIKPIHRLMLYVYKESLLTRIRSQDKIVLYGAGRYGEKFLEFLHDNNLSRKVSCFVVSDLKINVHEIKGITVKGLPDFLQETGNKRVMVTVAKRFQKEIGDILCEKGYENYEIISHDFLYALIMDPTVFPI